MDLEYHRGPKGDAAEEAGSLGVILTHITDGKQPNLKQRLRRILQHRNAVFKFPIRPSLPNRNLMQIF